MKPARTVIHRSPHRKVGAIHAPWFQPEPIHYESDLERGAVEVMLLMPMARQIRHQPMTLNYELDGGLHRYTPDFQVTFVDGQEIVVEVKAERFVDEHRGKFDRCASQLLSGGIDFFVCTDLSLDDERIGRACALRDAARRAAPPEAVSTLLRWVQEAGRLQIGESLEAGIDLRVVMHAVGRRLLTVGPELDLASVNWLQLMEPEDGDLCCSSWLGSARWTENMAL
ncbi:Tn7 transposase TnsA N-terminal domain-containing protein [Roseateles amylovorans]|uniref:Tn7 transposase TnsA N-terminal domain-containing protein n=1 Tax=Roseateles amylovorans TaxID=2978473 RepID=A0ABY6B1Q5_9BURK|nr:Tn7 transposase TnsA N-terminal domain-containing protein [Roseateles amylovorans]UXH77914.1 Tn7 transposase TnsA N-terminal domain-containing protein [Roseateles amylovorans]